MNQDQINELLKKFRSNTLSEQESAFLEEWYFQYYDHEGTDYKTEDRLYDSREIWNSLPVHPQIKHRRLFSFVAAAASILMVITSIYYFTKSWLNTKSPNVSSEIAAGKNAATLTLPNGNVISLSEAKSGIIIGTDVLSYSDGSKVADVTIQDQLEKTEFINAQTPRGGMYQFMLPDGSSVWLNAASSIKFPSSFIGLENRTIELKGEAYFEVVKSKQQPFIVKAKKISLTVLGTHFNVSAYDDEVITKATLLEGSILVNTTASTIQGKRNESVIIKPNEQVLTTGFGKLNVESINAAETILWKNGKFSFDNEELSSVMRKIARWYNIEVFFKDPLQKVKLHGSISRYAKVSQLLEMLENTKEVSFKIEGRKIIVTNYLRE